MDPSTVGAALKRKLGPLPVWIWATVGGVVVYYLRSKGYFGGSGADSGTALQPSQANASPTRDPITLQPGESAYDPGSGSLVTAPGGGTPADVSAGTATTGGGTGSDDSDALNRLADAIIDSRTDSVSTDPSTPTTHKPTALDRAKTAVTRGKVGPKNEARLEKAGYTKSQIAYHLKRHTGLGKPRGAKPKTAHKQTPSASAKGKKDTSKAGTHTPTTSHAKSRTRSSATTKTATGRSRTTKTPTKSPKARTATTTARSTARQRPTTATVHHAAPVQHQVSAAHKTATQKASAAHAAKPTTRPASAPAPRAAAPRAAAPKKVTPPPKKRK